METEHKFMISETSAKPFYMKRLPDYENIEKQLRIYVPEFMYQSPRKFFFQVLPMFGRMCVCMCVCMYVCPFDYSHTIQPRALKFWDMIPRVIF